MFTKTTKKYIALGLVLAFCSASSMAEDYEKTLTAEQYQPMIIKAGMYFGQGLVVTGTTLTGCSAPLTLYLPIPEILPETNDAKRFDMHVLGVAMDIVTKAKAAGRPISVSYSADGSSSCMLMGITMK